MACGGVLAELARLGIGEQDTVISTNVPTRLDGLPRSGAREPFDPGVAVYWQERSGARRVMAIDRYTTVADNLAAVAATLEAMRAIAPLSAKEFYDSGALRHRCVGRLFHSAYPIPKKRTANAVRFFFRARSMFCSATPPRPALRPPPHPPPAVP